MLWNKLSLHSLPVQLVLSLVALVFLTALTIGVPAILLIHGHLEQQSWHQLEQGLLSTRALYAAQRSKLSDQATLAAQRPTLREKVLTVGHETLPAYLHTLQGGLGTDLVLVCGEDELALASIEAAIVSELCVLEPLPAVYVWEGAGPAQVWLLESHDLGDADLPVRVVVGVVLDQAWLASLQEQTGLQQSLLVRGEPLVTTLPGGDADRSQREADGSGGAAEGRYDLAGRPYHFARFPLDGPAAEVEIEVALSLEESIATQQRIAWGIVLGILVVSMLGSLLGTLLARRIGRPLARLADAAASLRQGELHNAIAVESRVREITLLAQSLEGARADLQRNLEALRRERSWGQHLLEAIVEGIVTLDRYGRINFFSQGAERITGWRREQVLGQGCDQVLRPADAQSAFFQMLPGPGQSRKISILRADKRQITLAVTGARLSPPAAGAARVALVFRDVSEEEAVHRLLGHFLADAAHEFRTPLAALAASNELLLQHNERLSPQERHELLLSSHLGILGLQSMVDNLLESASIEAGHFRVSPRPVDLEDLVRETVHVMQPLLDKYGQTVRLDWPPELPLVLADRRRTAQVLINLLSNASKYGPEQAEITVGADLQGEWVRIYVADRGPGIPPDYCQDVFRRFVHRSLEQERAQVGAGLGLSVVKAIVEAHGGQVGVEGRDGGGAVFYCTFPLAGEA